MPFGVAAGSSDRRSLTALSVLFVVGLLFRPAAAEESTIVPPSSGAVESSGTKRPVVRLQAAEAVVPGAPQETQGRPELVSIASQVSASNGALQATIPIKVPQFRGLEPKLALAYSPALQNGLVGVGWSLVGLSVIERASPGRGAPRFDATDTYLLDGQELIESNALGGTHCTKVQTYRRIVNHANASWTVYDPSGIRYEYTVTMGRDGSPSSPGTTFRWYLTTVSDPRGNQVTYGYTYDPASSHGDCYPSSITYNGTTITFHRGSNPRQDTVRFAAGSFLGQTRYLLEAISMTVGGSRVRAYDLVYAPSGTTSKAVLQSVQEFGDDYSVTTSGGVSGVALPATTLTYSASTTSASHGGPLPSSAPFAMSITPAAPTVTAPGWSKWDYYTTQSGDFDGDGKADVQLWYKDSTGLYSYVLLSRGNGTFAPPIASPWNQALPASAPPLDTWLYESGDYNGDGKTDFRIGRSTAAGAGAKVFAEVFLSDGDGTFTAVPWQHTFTANPGNDYKMEDADFDGDGMTDLRFAPDFSAGRDGFVFLADGDGTFSDDPVPSPGIYTVDDSCVPANKFSQELGDYNGDGKTDVREHWGKASSSLNICSYTMLARGDGSFSPPKQWLATVPSTATSWDYSGIIPGDYNGDGKTDIRIHVRSQGSLYSYVAFSNGDGSFTLGDLWPWSGAAPTLNFPGCQAGQCGWNHFWGMEPGDFNGDGYADFRLNSSWPAELFSYTYYGKGDGSFTDPVTWHHPSGPPVGGYWVWDSGGVQRAYQLVAGDHDGDGKTDWTLIHGTDSALSPFVGLAAAPQESPLVQIANGFGGTTTVSYRVASSWAGQGDPYWNNPPPVQTVSSLVTRDNGSVTASTAFSYRGGQYDRKERRFLGWHKTTKTLPCIAGEAACPTEDTWFEMTLPSAGKPNRVERRDGSGTLRSVTQYAYAVSGDGAAAPFTSLESQVVRSEYDSSGIGSLDTRVDRPAYDPYGNVTRELMYGFNGTSGADERTVLHTYSYDSTDYIVDRPGQRTTYDGLVQPGQQGALMLDDARFFYDGYGSLTHEEHWLDTTGAYLGKSFAYDSYGNLQDAWDESGIRTAHYDYDSSYHLFPIRMTNALGQAPPTPAQWLAKCGALADSCDLNGQHTVYQYDRFCRLDRVDQPGGEFADFQYLDFDVPGSKRVRIEHAGANAAGNLWEETYFDGFGRTTRTVKRGPSAATPICDDVTYNARGGISGRTLPYYGTASGCAGGGTRYWTTFGYDPLDRPTIETYPDQHASTRSYGISSDATIVTSQDVQGHRTEDASDAYGRVIRHSELLSGAWQTTSFDFDARGNPAATTDPYDNVTAYSYDSLGRMAEQDDPDLGRWTFHYFDTGRLEWQIDALGQQTRHVYDALGRLTETRTRYGTLGETVVSWRFDEPRAGYFNLGHRTSSVDSSGSYRHDYDAAGREIHTVRCFSDSTPFGPGPCVNFPLTRTFDAGGRLTSVTHPDGDFVGPIGYDSAGRPCSIAGIVDSTLYDAAGHPTVRTNANGTVTTSSVSVERGWLTSIVTRLGAGSYLQDENYGRDAEGQVTSITSRLPGESWSSFTYNDLHYLLSATHADDATQSQSFSYDAIGNMTFNSRVGTYTIPLSGPSSVRPHSVRAAPPFSYEYDANGNLTSGGGRSLTYDGANRVEKIAYSGYAYSYAYDADGGRIKQEVAAPAPPNWGGGSRHPKISQEAARREALPESAPLGAIDGEPASTPPDRERTQMLRHRPASAAEKGDPTEAASLWGPWVNFAPPGSPAPANFVNDDGSVFTSARGYGWDQPVAGAARGSHLAPELDTLVFSQATRTWTIEVPNGDYAVEVSSGDAQFPQGPQRVAVQSYPAITEIVTAAGESVQGTVQVPVRNGRLTVEMGGLSGLTTLNYVKSSRIASTSAGILSWNFQPATSVVPLGFLVDSGAVFDATRGYGWLSAPVVPRERNAEVSQVLDTLVFTATSRTWEADLADGTYDVWISVGDAAFPQGPQRVLVEGQTLVDGESTAAGQFIERFRSVTVNDGRISVEIGGGGGNTTLNYIVVAPSSLKAVNFQPSDSTAPSGFLIDSGQIFDGQRGYGWSAPVSTQDRNREQGATVPPSLGTMALTALARTWEIAVPDGLYEVHVSVGDASFAQGPQRLTVEGAGVVNDETTAPGEFIERWTAVFVADGRLTLEVGGGGGNTALNYVTLMSWQQPSAPTALQATALSYSEVRLSWTDNSDDEGAFLIQRRDPQSSIWKDAGYVPANVTTFTSASLQASTTYSYRVKAVRSPGVGSSYTSVSVTTLPPPPPPTAPSNLEATATGPGQVQLQWIDNATTESSFKIERRLYPSGSFAQVASAPANSTTYGDTTVSSGTSYEYRVRASNVGGDSAFSNSATATTATVAPAIPTNLQVSVASALEIRLSWTLSSNNEDGFTLQRKLGAGGTYGPLATLPRGARSFSDSSVSGTTSYFYRIAAYNSVGASGYSTEASVTTPPAPPPDLTPSSAAGRTVYIGDDFESAWNGLSVPSNATKYIRLGSLVVAKRVGTQTYWLHTDQLGSVRSITNASGAEVFHKSYRPYGNPYAATATDPEREAFTGQRQDGTGLLFLHARYMDPRLGRFISPDTIVPGRRLISLNRYAYADNNPTSMSDPSGHCSLGPDGRMTCREQAAYADWLQSSARDGWAAGNYGYAVAAGAAWALVSKPLALLEGLTQHTVGAAWNGSLDFANNSGSGDLKGSLEASARVGLAVVPLILPAARGATSAGELFVARGAAAEIGGVQANRIAGNAFRNEIAQALRAEGREVATEVYKATPFGRRFIDIEVSQNGVVLGGIETKWGGAVYSAAQRAKDMWLWLSEGYRVNVVRGPQ